MIKQHNSIGGPRNWGNVADIYDRSCDSYVRAFFNEETLKAEMFYLDSFLSFLPERPKILDVGCGLGIETKYICSKGIKYIGIDISERMLKTAQKLNKCSMFILMDMNELACPDGIFDGVISLESTIHIPKSLLINTLREIRRVMQFQAPFLIAVQEGTGSGVMNFPFDPCFKLHLTLFQEEELRQFLTSAGFHIIEAFRREPLPGEYEFGKLIMLGRAV